MRSPSRPAGPIPRALPLGLLLAALLPPTAAASPQNEERQIRREIVVVGSQPAHRRVIVDRLAERGYLGVHLLNLTPELRRHFGAAGERGVLVSRVAADSPAAAAGVAVGDVITSVGGEPVATSSQLAGRIGSRQEGDEIELEIVRDRSSITLRATVTQSERRQVEVGQFVWQSGDEGPFMVDLNPESIESVITVDPETINDSVSRLLQRLEAEGGLPGGPRLEGEQRREFEQRIAELEQRLLELERQLRNRPQDD